MRLRCTTSDAMSQLTVKNTFINVDDEDMYADSDTRTRSISDPLHDMIAHKHSDELLVRTFSESTTDDNENYLGDSDVAVESNSAPESKKSSPMTHAAVSASRVSEMSLPDPLALDALTSGMIGDAGVCHKIVFSAMPGMQREDMLQHHSSVQSDEAVQQEKPRRLTQKPSKGNNSKSSAKKAGKTPPDDERTTLMLRNLPNNYTCSMLVEMLDAEGFANKYDFVYLPMDFTTKACLGYAFVNLVDSLDALHFWAIFDGFTRWLIPSKKTCFVSWSDPHQGLQANIDRYKNSPVMHESVPEEYKPRLLRDGVQVPFPAATRKVRVPRLRRHAH
eukprot:TRINITY_DN5038_c0_g1_i1.p1 TRINITY_DN5038_c0_g1~~TRINITY_DN5038_c0_g1_i1.p1  ORF type:complete len:333 (+),score=46.18 TRINITY_DN5038_c0_g1_i1:25-1023(+)